MLVLEVLVVRVGTSRLGRNNLHYHNEVKRKAAASRPRHAGDFPRESHTRECSLENQESALTSNKQQTFSI